MKRSMRLASAVTAALLAGTTGCNGRQGDEPGPKQEEVFAAAPKERAVAIPLKSVYSTNGQKGLQPVRGGPDKPGGRSLELLRRDVRSGPSNVLLVHGGDIASAVRATWKAFAGGRSADAPVGPDDGRPKSTSLWLAAFLGSSSSAPPVWLVRSAEREGKVIRLSVLKPKHGLVTADIHQYFVWAPLGELDPGTYSLELYDVDKKEVALLRRVTVGSK